MTEAEQALSRELFGGQQQSMGAMGEIKEALLAVAPGLKDFGPEVTAELKQMGAHGAHELAAALFNGNQGGSAFVMYPRGTRDDQPSHEQAQDGQGMQQETPGQHMERGGRSM